MNCGRCVGMIASERFYGPEDPFGDWRCVFCGEILDPLIWQNRNDKKKTEMVNRKMGSNGRKGGR